jgi:hypothetical protein
LIITFMFDPAKLQMNCASASGNSILRAEPTDPAPAGLGTPANGRSLTPSGYPKP